MLTSDQLRHFQEEGYIIIEGIEPSMLEPLRNAAERVTAKARAGEWQAARRCPDSDDIWGVSSLLSPDLNEPIFAEYLATDRVLDVARDLLQDDDLRLGLTNMLVNPVRSDYQIAWHRDAFPREKTGDEELQLLNKRTWGVQWNAALCDEACLRIVPGSHRRVRTEAERDVVLNRPTDPMPDELRVELKAGQTVYYTAALLHTGDYPRNSTRLTLHANFVTMDEPEPPPLHYHAVKFMEAPGFADRLPERLRPLHANWLKFAERMKRIEADQAAASPTT